MIKRLCVYMGFLAAFWALALIPVFLSSSWHGVFKDSALMCVFISVMPAIRIFWKYPLLMVLISILAALASMFATGYISSELLTSTETGSNLGMMAYVTYLIIIHFILAFSIARNFGIELLDYIERS